MNVPLTSEAAKVVNERIERGEFQSPAEVVDDLYARPATEP